MEGTEGNVLWGKLRDGDDEIEMVEVRRNKDEVRQVES